ncbi:MAG: 2-oxo acid dehydrogenase subunit E2 [Actinomycetota bacterium]|nr:2-oxo acid dehydrogenase subunit E2 [Actinomycetota bacterium]
MPQLGESVTEGTITRWLKAEGDEIAMDEPLAEVDTDKVNADLPSPVAGKIEKLLISEGDTVDVGTEIALVAVSGASEVRAETPTGDPPQENIAADALTEEFPALGTEAEPVVEGSGDRVAAAASNRGNGQGTIADGETLRLTRSSPVVRRLAAEHGLEITQISGTGIGGRVTKKDIESYIQERGPETEKHASPGLREECEAFAAAPTPIHEGDTKQPLTPTRRAIANRMSLSKREAPHAWAMVEVDMTGLVKLREREKAAFAEREGVKLTYLPFIVVAVVEGLKEYPVVNSVWDGDAIILKKRVNIGVAVDLEDALIVPVIPNADELNIRGLTRKIDTVVKRARGGRLDPQDISGGTFTVNNPGALGSIVSTPIINHPQAAILSAEAIVKRPVVVDDAIAIRSMMNLEVSFDHRIFDGGVALKFLNSVKRRLEGYGPESKIV